FRAGPGRDGLQLPCRSAGLEMAFPLAGRRTLETFRLLLSGRSGGHVASPLHAASLNQRITVTVSFRRRLNHCAGAGMKIFFPTIRFFGSNPGLAFKIWSVVTLIPCSRYALAIASKV